MRKTIKLPKYFSDHKSEILEGFKHEKATPYKAQTWLKHFSGDAAVVKDLNQICSTYPESIARKDIEYLARSTQSGGYPGIRRLFLACMIWGWGNRGVGMLNTKSTLSSPAAKQVFEASLEQIKKGKIIQAYTEFNLPSCGPAFFTKFFYFIGLGFDVKPLPVILDSKVAQCLEFIGEQEGWDLGEFAIVDRNKEGKISRIKPYLKGYLNYVYSMDSWAKQLGCGGDHIEYFMYVDRDEDLVGKGVKMGKDNDKKELKVRLPARKMELLQKVAKEEFGVDASTLAQIWIMEQLRHGYRDLIIPQSQPSPEVEYVDIKVNSNQIKNKWQVHIPAAKRHLFPTIKKRIILTYNGIEYECSYDPKYGDIGIAKIYGPSGISDGDILRITQLEPEKKYLVEVI